MGGTGKMIQAVSKLPRQERARVVEGSYGRPPKRPNPRNRPGRFDKDRPSTRGDVIGAWRWLRMMPPAASKAPAVERSVRLDPMLVIRRAFLWA